MLNTQRLSLLAWDNLGVGIIMLITTRNNHYFDDGNKKMLIIYREEAIDELVDIIYDMDVAQPIKVYVFSPSEDPWEGSFEDVSDKVELCALPQAIYNTYRRILPKKKDAVVMPEDDALATTEKEEEQFNGMLNFEYDEEA